MCMAAVVVATAAVAIAAVIINCILLLMLFLNACKVVKFTFYTMLIIMRLSKLHTTRTHVILLPLYSIARAAVPSDEEFNITEPISDLLATSNEMINVIQGNFLNSIIHTIFKLSRLIN